LNHAGKYAARLQVRDYKYSTEPASKMLLCSKLFKENHLLNIKKTVIEFILTIYRDTNFRLLIGMPKVNFIADVFPKKKTDSSFTQIIHAISDSEKYQNFYTNTTVPTALKIFSEKITNKYNLDKALKNWDRSESSFRIITFVYLQIMSIDAYLQVKHNKNHNICPRNLLLKSINSNEFSFEFTGFLHSFSSSLALIRMIQINKSAMRGQVTLDVNNKFTLEYARGTLANDKKPMTIAHLSIARLASEFPAYTIAQKIKIVITAHLANSPSSDAIYVVRVNTCYEEFLKIELKKHFPRAIMKELLLPGKEMHLLERQIKNKF